MNCLCYFADGSLSRLLPDRFVPLLPEDHQIGEPQPLFEEMDQEMVRWERKLFAFSEFQRITLQQLTGGGVACGIWWPKRWRVAAHQQPRAAAA